MLNETEYNELRAKIDRYDSETARRFTQPNGWIIVPVESRFSLPPAVSGTERSAVEVYEFHRDKPDRYFCYVREDSNTVTNFAGDTIGRVSFGNAYRDNFGGERVPVTVVGVNGIRYHGTYYRSAGDYARLKAYANQAV